jgi:sugar phosphate permease
MLGSRCDSCVTWQLDAVHSGAQSLRPWMITIQRRFSRGVSGRVVALLTIAALINYIDRGNLATAGPLIRDQFALSNAQLGALLSAFFWTYTPGQLPAGWFAERLDPRRVLAAGLAIWGAATALRVWRMAFLCCSCFA